MFTNLILHFFITKKGACWYCMYGKHLLEPGPPMVIGPGGLAPLVCTLCDGPSIGILETWNRHDVCCLQETRPDMSGRTLVINLMSATFARNILQRRKVWTFTCVFTQGRNLTSTRSYLLFLLCENICGEEDAWSKMEKNRLCRRYFIQVKKISGAFF